MSRAREQTREVVKKAVIANQVTGRMCERAADAASDIWEPLLRAVVGGLEECMFDHDGNCQEHLHFGIRGRCPVGAAKEALGE